MKKLKPMGNRLLVYVSETKNFVTESKIELVELTLQEVTVAEVSDELKDIYKVNDTLLISQRAGISQFYNGKPHLWISGASFPNGDVWCIVNEK